jgi:hypothetical protein
LVLSADTNVNESPASYASFEELPTNRRSSLRSRVETESTHDALPLVSAERTKPFEDGGAFGKLSVYDAEPAVAVEYARPIKAVPPVEFVLPNTSLLSDTISDLNPTISLKTFTAFEGPDDVAV